MAVMPILHVSDVESALAFYRDSLRFSVVWDMPDDASGKVIHAELEFDESQVMIGLLPEESGENGRLGAGVQPYFRVNRDVDAYFEQLRSAGVQITEELADQFYGDRTFSIKDPNGYRLTFAQIGIPASKVELMERIDEAWEIFREMLAGLSDEQLTGPRDNGGWSVKDHLAHLAAWERSMVYLLQGRPRHEGLGVSEDVYLTEDEDAINAVIWEQNKDRSLEDVRDDFESVHRQMIETLNSLTYDELLKTYSDYLPDEPGEDSGEPIIGRVLGNTKHHLMLHRRWILRLLG